MLDRQKIVASSQYADGGLNEFKYLVAIRIWKLRLALSSYLLSKVLLRWGNIP